MQEFNTMDTEFSLPVQDKEMYQNLVHLFAEGHTLPLKLPDGRVIGQGHYCRVADDEDIRGDGLVSMRISFALTEIFEGALIDLAPVLITYRFLGRTQFSVLSHFLIIVAPQYKTKF